jgi:hypothetical protein
MPVTIEFEMTVGRVGFLGGFMRARLMFEQVPANGRHEAASHGSALFGFGVDLTPLSHWEW